MKGQLVQVLAHLPPVVTSIIHTFTFCVRLTLPCFQYKLHSFRIYSCCAYCNEGYKYKSPFYLKLSLSNLNTYILIFKRHFIPKVGHKYHRFRIKLFLPLGVTNICQLSHHISKLINRAIYI